MKYGIYKKWKDLFLGVSGINSILQGPIGYSSINKFIVFCLKADLYKETMTLIENISCWIDQVNVPSQKWYPKGDFASYSSEAGYTIIAKTLMESMKK